MEFGAMCGTGLGATVPAGSGVGASTAVTSFRAALVMVLLAAASVMSSDRAAIAQSAVQTSFNVPAGPLSRALTTFGRQAGLQVTYLTAVSAGMSSPGASGRIGTEEALVRILYGTGLNYSFPNATTVVVSGPPASVRHGSVGEVLVLDADVMTAAIQVAFAIWSARAPSSAREELRYGAR